jgi:ATP-dependent Lon protease
VGREVPRTSHDLDRGRAILDADHYGLEKVKERILEYLAVQALAKKLKGPILCLVGPPGVGKTSLAQVDRQGHRPQVRAHVAGRRARRGRDPRPPPHLHRRDARQDHPVAEEGGTNNPVFLLDEIDKMAMDFRGDPSAALLEVLDPEQNNDLQRPLPRPRLRPVGRDVHHHGQHLHAIPLPLQDRMEIIELSGYTEWEKLEIARRELRGRAPRHGPALLGVQKYR